MEYSSIAKRGQFASENDDQPESSIGFWLTRFSGELISLKILISLIDSTRGFRWELISFVVVSPVRKLIMFQQSYRRKHPEIEKLEVEILGDLTVWHVMISRRTTFQYFWGRLQFDTVSSAKLRKQEDAIVFCKNMCYSDIRCQYWLYAPNYGCYLEDASQVGNLIESRCFGWQSFGICWGYGGSHGKSEKSTWDRLKMIDPATFSFSYQLFFGRCPFWQP